MSETAREQFREPIALPVPVPAVMQFLVDHIPHTADDGPLVHDLPLPIGEALVAGGFKAPLGAPALNTVMHRLSVLSGVALAVRTDIPLR